MKTAPKPKYQLIPADGDPGAWIYATIRDLVRRHHGHLLQAAIEPAWMIGRRADPDGNLVLGQLRVVTEREWLRTQIDLVIELNVEAFGVMTEAQRVGLLDHELCHAMPRLDKVGEQKTDGHGRLLWRTRKHDIGEFRDVVRRHGCYMDDVRRLVEAALEHDGQLALDLGRRWENRKIEGLARKGLDLAESPDGNGREMIDLASQLIDATGSPRAALVAVDLVRGKKRLVERDAAEEAAP